MIILPNLKVLSVALVTSVSLAFAWVVLLDSVLPMHSIPLSSIVAAPIILPFVFVGRLASGRLVSLIVSILISGPILFFVTQNSAAALDRLLQSPIEALMISFLTMFWLIVWGAVELGMRFESKRA